MSTYSISDLEKLTGIKAHTIRMWEQRYNLIAPTRSEGNVRYYDDDQVRHFIQVATLVRSGYKISKVSQLDNSTVYQLVEDLVAVASGDSKIEYFIDSLISTTIDFNEHAFQALFTKCINTYGLIGTYQKVIYPMLVKIGMMWGKTELIPAQEHFITHLIKQKIYHALDVLPSPPKNAPTWLLFLPEEEDHELGLILSNYILRSYGQRVIYLGPRVPYYNLKAVIESVKPDYMHYFIVRYHSAEVVQALMEQIQQDFPGITKSVAAAEYLVQSIQLPSDHTHISGVDSLIQYIQSNNE